MTPSLRLFLPLALLSAGAAAVQVAYAAVNIPPSWLARDVLSYSLWCYILLWAIQDAYRHRRTPCYDFGFLMVLGSPFSVLWYSFWSRGLRGFAVLGILIGLYLAPYLCSGVAWGVFTVVRGR